MWDNHPQSGIKLRYSWKTNTRLYIPEAITGVSSPERNAPYLPLGFLTQFKLMLTVEKTRKKTHRLAETKQIAGPKSFHIHLSLSSNLPERRPKKKEKQTKRKKSHCHQISTTNALDCKPYP